MSTTSSGSGSLSRYAKLAGQEAQFWGHVRPRADNPQLWDDPFLFEIFIRPQWDVLIGTVKGLGHDILEVGCGEGNLSIELASNGLYVDGLDISEDRVRCAEEKAETMRGSTVGRVPRFEVADLNTKILQPARYDVVVAHDALHHIMQLDRLLDEIRHTLRPGGSLVVYDFVGMKTIRKFVAAFLFALLPTYQPYRMKFRLAKRFFRFMQSEEGKRRSLERASAATADGSPFEEISQTSIVSLIEEKFDVIEKKYFHPFFYYLAPKVRVPKRFHRNMMRYFAFMDKELLRRRIADGAYVYIVARKRS